MSFNPKQIAEEATLGSFLNCYVRETGSAEWVQNKVRLRLVKQQLTFDIRVLYRSPTGRHRYGFPIRYQQDGGRLMEADYLTAIVMLVRELSLTYSNTRPDELVMRVIESCRSIEQYVRERGEIDNHSLDGSGSGFIQTEQSLLFGHPTHPAPKSRQGFPAWMEASYSPELGGQFRLHYFWAHRDLVVQDSAAGSSAAELVAGLLEADSCVDEQVIRLIREENNGCLVPVHPHQAQWLLEQPKVREWSSLGLLVYLGPQGTPYYPTSSVRTVYHPEAEYMVKLSLQIKITNSVRVNKRKELAAGVEAARLFKVIAREMGPRFPRFTMIHDPAYIDLGCDGEVAGFGISLRENPFKRTPQSGAEPGCGSCREVSLIAALVEDGLPGHPSRLAAIIHNLSEQEGRTTSQVSLDWFRRYLDISLKPMMWMFLRYGIALEAHQQNGVLEVREGYPYQFYYRDNQGYYYCRSAQESLNELLPGIGDHTDNIYDDRIVDDRFRYYLFVNHLFGLINGFGTAGLIEEGLLLAELRSVLESFLPINREPSRLLLDLLTDSSIPCKANLLTRIYDMDELENPLEQAVYVRIPNPLVTELPDLITLRKAKRVTLNWRKERVLHSEG